MYGNPAPAVEWIGDDGIIIQDIPGGEFFCIFKDRQLMIRGRACERCFAASFFFANAVFIIFSS